jgi:Protein of unknown function (DUF3102)
MEVARNRATGLSLFQRRAGNGCSTRVSEIPKFSAFTAHVIETSQRLAEAKVLAGHGGWLPWLEREFGWDERTAQRYMSAYQLSLKYDTVSDLDLPMRGLYLLARPSTPEPVRQEVIQRTEAGEHFIHAEVKETARRRPQLKVQRSRHGAGAGERWGGAEYFQGATEIRIDGLPNAGSDQGS